MVSFNANANTIYVPADFNMFFYDARKDMDDVRYSRTFIASEEFVDELVRCIIQNPNSIIVVDLKNIVGFPARAFRKYGKYLNRVIFYNLEDDDVVENRIANELSGLVKVRDKRIHNLMCLDSERENAKRVVDQIVNIRIEHLNDIIKSMMSFHDKADIPLESSGLFTNFYIDTKKLFLSVEDLYYVIFLLANKIYGNMRKVDAIVSSGKNGAILASILAGLFEIKEVHIIGVGPKYAMNFGDSIGCIKEGKKYAFVFDFMCTGTEFKLVSALINSKKGILDYAAGIAKYRKDTGNSVLNYIDVLAIMRDLEKDYRVIGWEE